MIKLETSNLILVPLVFNLAVVFGWWVIYRLRETMSRPQPVRARIYRCAVCEHVYVDVRNVPLSRCSHCGCLNEAVKR